MSLLNAQSCFSSLHLRIISFKGTQQNRFSHPLPSFLYSSTAIIRNVSLIINFIIEDQQGRRMIDKSPNHKKRTKSYIQVYEQRKQLLPFIKPRYIKEDMFKNIKQNSNKTTQRTKSTQKYSEKLMNYRCQTQGKGETSPARQEELPDQNRIRFKLKDFYRNMIAGQMKQQTMVREDEVSDEQYNGQDKIHFTFVRRRAKKNHYRSQKRQEVHSPVYQQPISHQKILYTPVLLNRNFTHKIEYSEPKGKQAGVIKRQSIKIQDFNNSQSKKIINKNNFNKKELKRKFRKIANAVLFIEILKRYNKKFQSRRKRYLEINSSNIQQKLLQLKLYFSQKCSPLYENLSLKYQYLYQILEKDSEKQRNKKISSIKSLMGILIDCISKGIDDLKGRTNFIELIYGICKHGSFSCLWNFHTPQELDISCISPERGYICGDHYLEQSYIIGFVFIKIIIFNIFLKPELINFSLSPSFDKTKVYVNIRLLGNIFYELLIDLQDNFLELADDKFKIGNWRNLTYKYDIRTSQSMTVKKGLYQKNQLISGLTGHSYIKETYKIDEMKNESKIVQELVLKIHLYMKEYHIKMSKNCM